MMTLRKLLPLTAILMLLSLSWGCQVQTGALTFSGGALPALNSDAHSKQAVPESKTVTSPTKEMKTLRGTVVEAQTRQPIAGATVFHDGVAHRSAADGSFELKKTDVGKPVLVKAPGYRQASVSVSENTELKISLKPFDVKGLYLTHFGVSSKLLRNHVLSLIDETDLNAVVIDVKGDRGLLSSKYDVPLAGEIGALKLPTIKDVKSFIRR